MSEETKDSSEVANTKLYLSVFDSSIRILLISSTEVFFAATNVTSEIEPTGTGVRIAMPSNLFSNCGSALIVAIAAPVEAGIKFITADLPIRRSLLEGASTREFEEVKEWMVFKIAFFIPIFLSIISITVPILLVVQLAQENNEVLLSLLFTPCNTVGVSLLLVGAEITTFFAP